MTRLDRLRLEQGVFPHQCQVATRYSDMDQLGHVNNVAAAEILQQARYQFMIDGNALIFAPVGGLQLVVAASLIEYAADLLAPNPIEVFTGVLEIGRTSFRLGHIARQGKRIGLYAEIVQVVRDAKGPAPVPAAWLAKLQGLKILAA